MTNPLRATIAALMVLGGCTQGADPAGPTGASSASWLTTRGVVDQGTREKGWISFELTRVDQRFVLEIERTPDANAMYAALKESNESRRSMTVRYDPDEGEIDRDAGKPSYVVREVIYDGKTLRGMSGTLPRAETLGAGRQTRAESALIRGVALYNAEQFSDARAALDRSLLEAGLSPDLRALAHKTRGKAIRDEVAARSQSPTAEGDKQLVLALSDFDAWAALAPESAEPLYAIAHTLRQLGAYTEALAIYERVARGWKDEQFWPAIRIGATYRLLGDHARALAALDALAVEHQDGMAFHYHRGWTLTELARFDEAAVEFSEGLEDQPDYSWAFVKRACAHARSGKLTDALSDQEEALRLLHESADEASLQPFERHDLERATAVAAELRGEIKLRKRASSTPCDGYWGSEDTARERSAYLRYRQDTDQPR